MRLLHFAKKPTKWSQSANDIPPSLYTLPCHGHHHDATHGLKHDADDGDDDDQNDQVVGNVLEKEELGLSTVYLFSSPMHTHTHYNILSGNTKQVGLHIIITFPVHPHIIFE